MSVLLIDKDWLSMQRHLAWRDAEDNEDWSSEIEARTLDRVITETQMYWRPIEQFPEHCDQQVLWYGENMVDGPFIYCRWPPAPVGATHFHIPEAPCQD